MPALLLLHDLPPALECAGQRSGICWRCCTSARQGRVHVDHQRLDQNPMLVLRQLSLLVQFAQFFLPSLCNANGRLADKLGTAGRPGLRGGSDFPVRQARIGAPEGGAGSGCPGSYPCLSRYAVLRLGKQCFDSIHPIRHQPAGGRISLHTEHLGEILYLGPQCTHQYVGCRGASTCPDHEPALPGGQSDGSRIRAGTVASGGQARRTMLLQFLLLYRCNRFFAVPVILEPFGYGIADALLERLIADDTHEVVEGDVIFRTQRRAVIAPATIAHRDRQKRNRDDEWDRFRYVARLPGVVVALVLRVVLAQAGPC